MKRGSVCVHRHTLSLARLVLVGTVGLWLCRRAIAEESHRHTTFSLAADGAITEKYSRSRISLVSRVARRQKRRDPNRNRVGSRDHLGSSDTFHQCDEVQPHSLDYPTTDISLRLFNPITTDFPQRKCDRPPALTNQSSVSHRYV